MQFVKLLKNQEVFYELVKDRTAFILLNVIAFRARHKKCTITGLNTGEAIVSDYYNYGLTRQEYRSAMLRLISYGFIAKIDNITNHQSTTVATTSQPIEQPIKKPGFIKRATVVKLENSLLFEVYKEEVSPKNNPPETTKEPARQPLNNHETTTLPTINKDSRLKTKDSIKKYKKEKDYSEDFEKFWQSYPRRDNDSKDYTHKAYLKAVKDQAFDFDKLMLSVANYSKLFAHESKRDFTKGAAVFLNQKMWQEEHLTSGVITEVSKPQSKGKASFEINKKRLVFNIYSQYKHSPDMVEAHVKQVLGKHIPFERIKAFYETVNKENVA